MELLSLVDRIIVLEKGKLVIDGPKESVLKQLKGAKGNEEVKL
jgi:ATP-binding cassette subfamily C protein LapB